MLWSGDRVAFARIGDSRAFRLGDGELRQITGDRTIGKPVWDASSWSRCSHGTWTEAGSFGRSWLAGPAGRRSLPVVLGRAEPGRRGPGRSGMCWYRRRHCRNRLPGLSVTRLRLTRLPRGRRGRDMPCRTIVPRRGTAQTSLGSMATARASVSRLTPYRCARSGMRGKLAPGSRYPPKMRARRSAAISGYRETPAGTSGPPPARCAGAYWPTMAQRDTRARANPGTTRPPGPSAKITQGARPCNRNPPCNLTR